MKANKQQPSTLELVVRMPGRCKHGRALRDHCRECESSFRKARAIERGTLDEAYRLRGMPELQISRIDLPS
jgi:hypothetical protein